MKFIHVFEDGKGQTIKNTYTFPCDDMEELHMRDGVFSLPEEKDPDALEFGVFGYRTVDGMKMKIVPTDIKSESHDTLLLFG